jgi:DNA-binding NtrC family response regulator
LLEQADGGTLFIDEIGEFPLDVQPMLLGAIERRSVRRIGDGTPRPCDVRFIAATNRNLAEEVRRGRFREDLYYRLAVARVHLPPLRERKEDILVLADQFAAEAGISLTPEVRALLLSYPWPGNVRELRNSMARLAIDPDALAAGAGPAEGATDDPVLRPLHDARRQATEQFERDYLERLWQHVGRDLRRAVEIAGTSRQHLGRLLARYGLRPFS